MGSLFLVNGNGEYSGFTANLNIDYRRPMPAPSNIAIAVWIERIDGRKVFLKGEAYSIGSSSQVLPSQPKPQQTAPPAIGTLQRQDSTASVSGNPISAGQQRILDILSAQGKHVKHAEARSLFIVPKDQYNDLLARGMSL
jgi:hypothetical protein